MPTVNLRNEKIAQSRIVWFSSLKGLLFLCQKTESTKMIAM